MISLIDRFVEHQRAEHVVLKLKELGLHVPEKSKHKQSTNVAKPSDHTSKRGKKKEKKHACGSKKKVGGKAKKHVAR